MAGGGAVRPAPRLRWASWRCSASAPVALRWRSSPSRVALDALRGSGAAEDPDVACDEAPAAAQAQGPRALLADYPPTPAPRRPSLFGRAQRLGGQDTGGWVL
jgi:hypothetical protein